MKPLLAVSLSILWSSTCYATAPETVEVAQFRLSTLTGYTYKNCQVMKVTPAYITVLHDGGVARISFDELDDVWRERFRYDPAAGASYLQEQEKTRQEEIRLREVTRQNRAAEQIRRAEVSAETARRFAFPTMPLAPLPSGETSTHEAGTSTSGEMAVPAEDPTVPVLPPITEVYTPTNTGRRLQSGSYPFDPWSQGYVPYRYGPSGYGYAHPYQYPTLRPYWTPPTIILPARPTPPVRPMLQPRQSPRPAVPSGSIQSGRPSPPHMRR